MERSARWKVMMLGIGLPLFCFSCGNGGGGVEESSSSFFIPSCSIYLEEDPTSFEVVTSNPVVVSRGQDASFTISLKSGTKAIGLMRNGAEAEANVGTFNGFTKITIPSVRYSASYSLRCEIAQQSILYHPNGGNYKDGSDPSSAFEVRHSLTHRLRPNTEMGVDRLEREGYVLTGWNTSSDGLGERIGLGSRVTLCAGEHLDLYANWEKESPIEDFEYTRFTDYVAITKYNGNDKKVVVPSFIGGVAVDRIYRNAFSSLEETVILPLSMKSIASGAFHNSHIKELYLYDTITNFSDSIIENCEDFSTIHINAAMAPKYGKNNLFSEINLADKYDILILNQEKKKLLAFGGSGTYLSVNTNTFEEALKDTVCINMAVNGWFNGVAQFEMMIPYLRNGDTFLHIPETSSQFSLMYGVEMAPEINGFDYNKTRFFATLESNYDLLGHVDFRHVKGLLTGFASFNADRADLASTSYTDFKTTISLYGKKYETELAYIDIRGNWNLPRPAYSNSHDAGEADIVLEYVTTKEAHVRLNSYYDKLRQKGVSVYFSTAAINRDTLEKRLEDPASFERASDRNYLYYGRPEEIPAPDYPNIDTWVADYEKALEENLNVEVLVPLSDSLFHTSDYFEPDYHLCDYASGIWTNRLLDAYLSKIGEAK